MSKEKNQMVPNNSFTEFLLYTTPDGKVKVEIFLKDENVWLTQKAIASLFGVQVPAISKHLKNIFESGELQEKVVISILEVTTEYTEHTELIRRGFLPCIRCIPWFIQHESS